MSWLGEKTKVQAEKETQKTEGFSLGLDFVTLLLLIEAIYFAFKALQSAVQLSADSIMFFEIVFIYMLAVVGIHKRKRFGFYMGLFVVSLAIMFSIAFMVHGIFVLGVLLSGFQFYLLLKNKKLFKEYDKTDKFVLSVAFLSVVLYLGWVWWHNSQPTAEERYEMVSREAREKNDVTICDRLSDSFWKDNCVKDYAYHSLNISLCDTINSKNVRDRCKSTVREKIKEESK